MTALTIRLSRTPSGSGYVAEMADQERGPAIYDRQRDRIVADIPGVFAAWAQGRVIEIQDETGDAG